MSDDTTRPSFPDHAPISPAEMLQPFLHLLTITGVTLSVVCAGGQREVVASSGEIASRLEELQFELGEGPGYEAIATGVSQQTSPRTDPTGSAPFFDAAVQDLAVTTIISLPLWSGAMVMGVVTLYRKDLGLLSAADMTVAAALVHWVAGPVIEQAIRSANAESLSGEERQGTIRREVHQATGIIAVQLDTTVGDALLRLKARAFSEDQTVGAAAHEVVMRQLNFTELKGHDGI